MAQQQKKEVTVIYVKPAAHSAYSGQWYVSGSGKAPYTVSEAKDGNWSCSCMAWTRTHPREDCKHIMRVKLQTAVPVAVPEPGKPGKTGMQLVQSTGRKFRD
jgi:hypothetical protein